MQVRVWLELFCDNGAEASPEDLSHYTHNTGATALKVLHVTFLHKVSLPVTEDNLLNNLSDEAFYIAHVMRAVNQC